MKLRKQDQEENFNRHKNEFQLNQKRKALMMQERLQRVEMVKQQQARIAAMVSVQRNLDFKA